MRIIVDAGFCHTSATQKIDLDRLLPGLVFGKVKQSKQ
jgi:hypothetical protein